MDYKNYFVNYSKEICFLLEKVDTNLINQSVELIKEKIYNNNVVYIVGNGGSASIASHVSVDFAKVANVQSNTFNNARYPTIWKRQANSTKGIFN